MSKPTVEEWVTHNLPLTPAIKAKLDAIERAIEEARLTGKLTEIRYCVPPRIGFTTTINDPGFSERLFGVDIYPKGGA